MRQMSPGADIVLYVDMAMTLRIPLPQIGLSMVLSVVDSGS